MNGLMDSQDTSERLIWLRTNTILTGILVLLLLVTAAAGLFGANVYDDFAPPKYVQESRAQDLITLVLGVPLLATAVVGVHRKQAWGVPLWAGALAYELYVYGLYAIGGVYNSFFLGYVAVAGLSMYSIIGLLSGVDACGGLEVAGTRLPRRWIGGFFLIITTIFTVVWLEPVMETISTGVVDSGHLIFVFDLMIVLPAFAITAVKLFRRQVKGDVPAGMLLIKFDSLCLAIVLGQWFRSLNGISVERELLGVFVPLGLIGLVLTGVYFAGITRKV